MLRTSLELAGENYIVIDVPSGEEALLELARGPVDLLVADLRLPGISGLELLEQVKQHNPNARAIILTGHPTEQARRKAEELGVIAFMTKPIRTSYFLEAVSTGLRGRPPLPAPLREEERAFMAEWLLAIQHELQAVGTFLLSSQGEVTVKAGELTDFDLKAIQPSLLATFSGGVKTSQALGVDRPDNFHFFAGTRFDIYLAAVGTEYALGIVFTKQKQSTQVGAVLQYARKAAVDLLGALYHVGLAEEKPKSLRGTQTPELKSGEPRPASGLEGREHSRERQTPLPEEVEDLSPQDAERYWDNIISDSDGTGPLEKDVLTYEEAKRRGLLPGDPET